MDDRPQGQDAITEHEDVQQRAADQVGRGAAQMRPDLAVDADDDRFTDPQSADRHRAAPDVTVADNAGQTPGEEGGNPDIGQEAGSVSEPG